MLEGWFTITAALLVLSGGSKFRDPEPTRGALRAAGLPSSRTAVYLLATGEVTAAAAGLLWPSSWTALAVAGCYLGFAGFVAFALLRRLPLQSCGCFGRSDTPPGPIHLGVDLSAAVAALLVATQGGFDLFAFLGTQPAAGIPYLAFAGMGTFLVALVLSELPGVLRASA